MQKIGIISEASRKVDFEWKIHDFFSYTEEDIGYFSPDFHLLNSVWQIEVRPNRKVTDEPTRYVSLFLHRVDWKICKPVDLTFGIKTVNHLVVNVQTTSWKKIGDGGWGWVKFIERNKLQQDSENLVPLGNLTIYCTLFIKSKEDSQVNARKNNLALDVKDMLLSKKNTDVTIKVKEVTFVAHRFILAARSPVLEAMLDIEMTDKKTGFIDITDCEPEAFSQFLLYLYSGELDSEKCDFLHLYEISHKYDVSELKQVCIDSIIQNISSENFCEIYVFGQQFNENKLLPSLHSFFKENFGTIVSLDSWITLMKECTSLASNLLVFYSKVK